jgi:hypothetical protein
MCNTQLEKPREASLLKGQLNATNFVVNGKRFLDSLEITLLGTCAPAFDIRQAFGDMQNQKAGKPLNLRPM